MDEVFVYVSFLFCSLILVTQLKHFKNWSEVNWDQKVWALISILMVLVTGLISLLLLIGAFD